VVGLEGSIARTRDTSRVACHGDGTTGLVVGPMRISE
jgi:hypothetical protein